MKPDKSSLLIFACAVLLALSKSTLLAGTEPAVTLPVVIPFELVNRNIYVKVYVKGRALWFVLDTGDKYAVIDLDIAKSLELDMGDPVPVGGAGEKTVYGHLVKDAQFSLAGLAGFNQPLFIAVPLTDLSLSSGHQFAGILGYDFISQFIIEIDYIQKTVTLRDKGSYQYRGTGESFPVTFNAAAHPQIRGQVVELDRPPIDATFVVDLGSGAALILNTPFVEAEHFLEKKRPVLNWLEGQGIGGDLAGLVGRVKALRLGRFTVDDPVVIFSGATTGPLASPESQGNLGAAILEKFKIILDYDRKRIILEPNTHFAEPIEYNRSGISLVREGDDFSRVRIDAVLENSPAS